MSNETYDMYRRGPDDKRWEQLLRVTYTQFHSMVLRGAPDNLYKLCDIGKTDPFICMRGEMEC